MKIIASISLGIAAGLLVAVYGPLGSAAMAVTTTAGLLATFTWLERRLS